MCTLGFQFVRGSDSGGGGLCNCHSLPFEYDYGNVVILELGVLCRLALKKKKKEKKKKRQQICESV